MIDYWCMFIRMYIFTTNTIPQQQLIQQSEGPPGPEGSHLCRYQLSNLAFMSGNVGRVSIHSLLSKHTYIRADRDSGYDSG